MRKGHSRESKIPPGFTEAEVDLARKALKRIQQICAAESKRKDPWANKSDPQIVNGYYDFT